MGPIKKTNRREGRIGYKMIWEAHRKTTRQCHNHDQLEVLSTVKSRVKLRKFLISKSVRFTSRIPVPKHSVNHHSRLEDLSNHHCIPTQRMYLHAQQLLPQLLIVEGHVTTMPNPRDVEAYHSTLVSREAGPAQAYNTRDILPHHAPRLDLDP